MKKLSEMSCTELMDCITKVSDPAERLFGDVEVIDALDEYRKNLDEKTTNRKALSVFSAVVIPQLMGKHKPDTYEILGVLRDQTAEEVGQSNGREVMADMFAVFGIGSDIEDLFRPYCEARS